MTNRAIDANSVVRRAHVPSRHPLSIAVLGCGNIGSAFASRLARAGHEVTVIARPGSKRLLQLRRDGGIVEVDGSRTAVRILDQLDPRAGYDLVIVTLLAHQVGAAITVLQASAADCVLFMFNTFEPDALVEAIGTKRCALGMPFVQAKLDDEGRLKARFGAGGLKTLLDQQRWVNLFAAADLPAALEPDMPAWLRSHAPLCVAFETCRSLACGAVEAQPGARRSPLRTGYTQRFDSSMRSATRFIRGRSG